TMFGHSSLLERETTNDKRETTNEQRISVLVLQSLETRGRSAIQPIAHDHQRHQADGANAQPDIFKHSVNRDNYHIPNRSDECNGHAHAQTDELGRRYMLRRERQRRANQNENGDQAASLNEVTQHQKRSQNRWIYEKQRERHKHRWKGEILDRDDQSQAPDD